MTNITKYKRHKNGFGLYSIVYTVSRKSIKPISHVSDQCSWKSLNNEYPNSKASKLDLMWKKMVIEGLNHGLSKIHHIENIEIVLNDIEGHIMHSNNFSMFAAGILAAFTEMKVNIDNEDLENLYEFVGNSKGKDLDTIPDINKLVFKEYYK